MDLIISVGDLGSLVQNNFCARCFWIQFKVKVTPFRMPLPGIFSSIDSYVKNVVRRYFDTNMRLPKWFPEIGCVVGYEDKLHWSRFHFVDQESGLKIRGVPDEVFHLKDGSYHIVDYKTSRYSRAQGYLYPNYEVQLNAYAYIAERINLAPVSALTLIYLDPDTDIVENSQWLQRSNDEFLLGFSPRVRTVDVRSDSFVEDLMAEAARIYKLSDAPAPKDKCKNCLAVEELVGLATSGPICD